MDIGLILALIKKFVTGASANTLSFTDPDSDGHVVISVVSLQEEGD